MQPPGVCTQVKWKLQQKLPDGAKHQTRLCIGTRITDRLDKQESLWSKTHQVWMSTKVVMQNHQSLWVQVSFIYVEKRLMWWGRLLLLPASDLLRLKLRGFKLCSCAVVVLWTPALQRSVRNAVSECIISVNHLFSFVVPSESWMGLKWGPQ